MGKRGAFETELNESSRQVQMLSLQYPCCQNTKAERKVFALSRESVRQGKQTWPLAYHSHFHYPIYKRVAKERLI